MTFLRKIYPLIILFIGIALGWYFTSFVYESNSTSRDEEIIGNEIKLLESTNKYLAPCAELKVSPDIIVTREQDFIMLWKVSGEGIEKLVVDKDFNSAIDIQFDACKSLTDSTPL